MIDYKFFQQLLQERLEKIQQRIDVRNTNIKVIQTSQHTDESDIVSNYIQGNLDMETIGLYHKELKDVENALEKIKKGTFGICEMCDDIIDVERLKAKPHARYCIKCRELFERNQKKE